MTVSSPIFGAFLECLMKCWLRSRDEPRAGNDYAEWARLRETTYSEDCLRSLRTTFPECDRVKSPPISRHVRSPTWRLATDVLLQTNRLESRLHALARKPSERRGGQAQFIPYRFQFSNQVTKNDKLLLAFDALVLAETLGCAVRFGNIVHGPGRRMLRVNLSPLIKEVSKQIVNIVALITDDSPPDLVLNAHCTRCEFRDRCYNLAKQKDDLSLLSGMSEKDRRTLHGKGIFTVTQLSYTFRPRRRRRQWRGKGERFHQSLRALAIRENKIHAVDILAPKLDGTPVYLDVEGVPDREFYYLIGIRIGSGHHAVRYSFWADDEQGERCIWNSLLDALSNIPAPRLVHFGRYETTFLKRMCIRYGGPDQGSVAAIAIERAVNVLSFVYAHIYFPTFSNGLKEIAGYLGFRWSVSPASGLEAIVSRHHWEASRDPSLKQALLDYNSQDCEALELVTNPEISGRPDEIVLGKLLAAKHQHQVIEPSRVDVANSLCIERVAQVDAADFGAYVPRERNDLEVGPLSVHPLLPPWRHPKIRPPPDPCMPTGQAKRRQAASDDPMLRSSVPAPATLLPGSDQGS